MKYNFLKNYSIEKIREFLSVEGKKVLVFDRDCDGICSAVLLSRIFPGFDAIAKREPKVSDEFLKTLIRKKAGLYVFLDMAADHGRRNLKKLKKALPNARIVIIDHHVPERNLNSRDIIHINPLFFWDVYIPTSYLVYRIMEKIDKKIRDFVWIPAMGCIADYAFRDVNDIYKECEKQYPGLIGKDPKRSRLKRGVEFIESIIMVKDLQGAEKSFEYLLNLKEYSDLLKIKELGKYWKVVKREYDKVLEEAKKDKEYIENIDLMMIEIKTNYKLSSAVSTYFSEKYPDRVIIVRRKTSERWSMSIRNGSGRVDVGTVAKKASKGIGSGGGHKKAAGARINDWEKFRKRVIRELEKQK